MLREFDRIVPQMWYMAFAGTLLAIKRAPHGCMVDGDADLLVRGRDVKAIGKALEAELPPNLKVWWFGPRHQPPKADHWYHGWEWNPGGCCKRAPKFAVFRVMIIGKDGDACANPFLDIFTVEQYSEAGHLRGPMWAGWESEPRERCKFGEVSTWCPTAWKKWLSKFGADWQTPKPRASDVKLLTFGDKHHNFEQCDVRVRD